MSDCCGWTFQSTSDTADRRRLLLYILLGLAGVLAVVFVVIFFQYCRYYRTDKQEELDELVSNSVTPAEYEVQSTLSCTVQRVNFRREYIVC